MNDSQPAPRYDQAVVRGAREGRDGPLELAGVADTNRAHLHPQRGCHGLDRAELTNSGRPAHIADDGNPRHVRRDLLDQLQPFTAETVLELHEAGGVAARAGQALDEAGGYRIRDDGEYDRNRADRLQQRRHGRAGGQDDLRRERGEFRHVLANAIFPIGVVVTRDETPAPTRRPPRGLSLRGHDAPGGPRGHS